MDVFALPQAELELAKARAAVVEAKAALAAAKASPEKIASGAEAAAPQGTLIRAGLLQIYRCKRAQFLTI